MITKPNRTSQSVIYLGVSLFLSLLIILTSFLSQAHRVPYLAPLDEGFILAGVSQMFRGDLIYTDFSTFYMPGIFYFFYLLGRLFGSSLTDLIMLERIVKIAVVSAGGVGYLFLARRYMHTAWAFIGSLLFVFVFGYGHRIAVEADLAVVCFVISLIPALAYYDSRKGILLPISGACAAAGILFHQLGLFVLAALAVFVYFVTSRPRRLAATAGFLAPSFLALSGLSGYYAVNHRLGDFLNHIVVLPLNTFQKAHRIFSDPGPLSFSLPSYLSTNFEYVPLFIFAFSAVYLSLNHRALKQERMLAKVLLLIGVCVALYPYYGRSMNRGHFDTISIPFNVLGFFLISRWKDAWPLRWAKENIVRASVSVVYLAAGILPLLLFYLGPFDKTPPASIWQGVHMTAAHLVGGGNPLAALREKYVLGYQNLIGSERGRTETLRFLEENVASDERLLVFPDNPLLYALSGHRPCVKRFDHFAKRVEDKYQLEDIGGLEFYRPPYIVFYTFGAHLHSFIGGYEKLLSHIQRHYRPIKTNHHYIILQRERENPDGHFSVELERVFANKHVIVIRRTDPESVKAGDSTPTF